MSRPVAINIAEAVANWIVDKKVDEKLAKRFGCFGALLLLTAGAVLGIGAAALAYHFWLR